MSNLRQLSRLFTTLQFKEKYINNPFLLPQAVYRKAKLCVLKSSDGSM